MDYRKMTVNELKELAFHFTANGNLNAATEVNDFLNVYGKKVEVVKGRKVPKGTKGTVFWVKRYDNSKYGDPWGIYSITKIGLKDDSGNVYFTAINNVAIIDK